MSDAAKNLSTEHQQPGDAKRPMDTLDRGRPAGVEPSGEVRGSGAGAGAGGAPGEDYDKDPQAGAGHEPIGAPRPAEEAERDPEDRHQGLPR